MMRRRQIVTTLSSEAETRFSWRLRRWCITTYSQLDASQHIHSSIQKKVSSPIEECIATSTRWTYIQVPLSWHGVCSVWYTVLQYGVGLISAQQQSLPPSCLGLTVAIVSLYTNCVPWLKVQQAHSGSGMSMYAVLIWRTGAVTMSCLDFLICHAMCVDGHCHVLIVLLHAWSY